eukprot:NODE_763_length_4425_cov_0.192094.p4 type:complete len:115 gc:universal NODE_763_length_4425_cov_0.192094:156-500(+)
MSRMYSVSLADSFNFDTFWLSDRRLYAIDSKTRLSCIYYIAKLYECDLMRDKLQLLTIMVYSINTKPFYSRKRRDIIVFDKLLKHLFDSILFYLIGSIWKKNYRSAQVYVKPIK